MLLIGDISKFDKVVTNNIQLGLREDKLVPCFVYEGNYNLNFGENIQVQHGSLSEIIEEVCYINNEKYDIKQQVLITRETGQSRKQRMPNSRISLIESHNNEIYVWRPLLSEIFEGFKKQYDAGGRELLTILREINESLGRNQDFKVKDLIAKHYNKEIKEITAGFVIYINDKFSVRMEAFFLLVKHIMITEDITYNRDGQMGRYLMQLAIYDYVVHNMELKDVLAKYGLKN
ncbi:hypothetical protein [Bacillus thuringiensis]|uniref:hypothetical protein n=1 Tax=Bacillus thuringiensis TaxID=1428 RepID=UPI000BFD94AB|nr:hypothetical protein [Bacillus thuringiensis]MCC6083089.1 hypothetical protein [Bacillus thuringiensis]PGV89408.1 hypothetical protein COD85_00410 [Bacillus thuringiensis]